MTPDDLTLIESLLVEEPARSCRSISRETGFSDWTIRKIKRELDGDPRPMKQRGSRSHEPPDGSGDISTIQSWLMFGGFVAVLALSIWAGLRWAPPPNSTDFYHGFYTDPQA